MKVQLEQLAQTLMRAKMPGKQHTLPALDPRNASHDDDDSIVVEEADPAAAAAAAAADPYGPRAKTFPH